MMRPAEERRRAALSALGLGPDASPRDILSAYRRLARSRHPDTAPGDVDPSAFATIAEAYRFLSQHGEHTPPEAEDGGQEVPPSFSSAGARDAQPRPYAHYRPDEPQVVAGPVIIRPLPPEAR